MKPETKRPLNTIEDYASALEHKNREITRISNKNRLLENEKKHLTALVDDLTRKLSAQQ